MSKDIILQITKHHKTESTHLINFSTRHRSCCLWHESINFLHSQMNWTAINYIKPTHQKRSNITYTLSTKIPVRIYQYLTHSNQYSLYITCEKQLSLPTGVSFNIYLHW